jgi:hypothetical protein
MTYDYDRFEDALKTRATQINPNDAYSYMTGYLLSHIQYGNSIEAATKSLEKLITEHSDPFVNEQRAVDLMWQHEPLQPLDTAATAAIL